MHHPYTGQFKVGGTPSTPVIGVTPVTPIGTPNQRVKSDTPQSAIPDNRCRDDHVPSVPGLFVSPFYLFTELLTTDSVVDVHISESFGFKV